MSHIKRGGKGEHGARQEARALGHAIFTQADDWEGIKEMMRDSVLCHFDDGEAPHAIRVHLVQSEVVPV